MGPYQLLYIDPPWPYAGRTNHSTKFGGGVHAHYKTMTVDELYSMRDYIHSLMDTNCAVLMWTTGPKTDMALDVVDSWNYKLPKKEKLRFVTAKAFTWVKVAKKYKLPEDVAVRCGRKKLIIPAGTTIPFQELGDRGALGLSTLVGPGNYTGSNTEDVMLFVKGRMNAAERLVPQVIFYPRLGHSKKPPEVRDRIVRAFGNVPRCELFARDRASGWDATGLELDGTDYLKFTQLAA